MSDNRKERERTELRRVIWNIANDLRGSVEGNPFASAGAGFPSSVRFYRGRVWGTRQSRPQRQAERVRLILLIY